MRILVISNNRLDPNLGAGYVTCGYAEHLLDRGHTVVCYGPEHFKPFNNWSRLNRLRLLFGYTYVALKEVIINQYDIVELWGAPAWMVTILLKLFPFKKPLLISRSNGLEAYSEYMERVGHPYNGEQLESGFSFSEIAFRFCDALSLVGDFDAAFAKAKNYQIAERILVIDNPLNDEWLEQKVDFSREPVIGFVGSWLARKGVDVIGDVIRLVLEKHPAAKFVLIGIGENGAHELSQITNGNKVEIIQYCSREDIMEKYHNMAILLFPSTYESFGLVAAEAMSCGVALMATPVGFAAGLKESEYVAIKNRTPAEISELILESLANESKRQSIAKMGYQRVQTLKWASAVDRLEEFYTRLLQKKWN